MMILSLTNHI